MCSSSFFGRTPSIPEPQVVAPNATRMAEDISQSAGSSRRRTQARLAAAGGWQATNQTRGLLQ